MPTPIQSSPADLPQKVFDRMSDILDAAAEAEGVSPAEFRRAVTDAMRYTDLPDDGVSPEAFVLSVAKQLF